MIVKDLQQKEMEKNGGKGRPGGAGQGEQVTPTPGFVAKTRSATHKGAKVFINVCSSEHVDAPAPVETQEGAASDEVQMRIPLSLGPPREDLDKSGEVCTVYDVVFHPDAVEGALKEAEFRSFVMQLTAHQIQQKYKDEISLGDLSFPKVKGNYKGVAPLPQIMRKKGTPPPPPPGSDAEKAAQAAEAAEAAAKEAANKPLVEELCAHAPTRKRTPTRKRSHTRIRMHDGLHDGLHRSALVLSPRKDVPMLPGRCRRQSRACLRRRTPSSRARSAARPRAIPTPSQSRSTCPMLMTPPRST
jgi:hypothetical protein